MKRSSTYLRYSLFLLLLLASLSHLDAATFYWFGGSGDWTDLNHWSKSSGNSNNGLTGQLPGQDDLVIIDENSSTRGAYTITIPPGNHAVNSLVTARSIDCRILFDGSSGNFAKMEVYKELQLSSDLRLEYADPGVFHNGWIFTGAGDHRLFTAGKDLSSVEFLSGDATYDLEDDLLASERIRMHGGVWNTNGNTVTASTLLFQDSNGSGNPITKVLNTSGSDFRADLWQSTFAYQSLTVNGDHQIFVKQFRGSPGTQLQSFSFDEIHLLDFEDNSPPGLSQIEYNNLDCTYCIIDKIIVEDVGRTQLAGIFTVETMLEVTTPGAQILFNGGNSRDDEVIINGSIKTPRVTGCTDRVIFSNVFNDFTTFIRADGTLTVSDAILNNIQASGGATFELDNGVLQGASSGWNLISVPQPKEYVWIGADGLASDWNVPGNWSLADGSNNGCIPTIVDNVTINNLARGDLRIPSPYLAECHNFTWTNTKSLTMLLDGQTIQESELKVTGDFQMDPSATISTVNNHELIFNAFGPVAIRTGGVALPDIYFEGGLAEFNLVDDLAAAQIFFASGTMNTNGYDVETDLWRSIENDAKQYNFGSSHLTINGTFTLASLPTSGVSCDPGTSLIECEQLENGGLDLHDVKLVNPTSYILDNFACSFDKLILAGAASVRTGADLTLNELEFTDGDSELLINPLHDLTVTESISSLASNGAPATLGSTTPGSQATITKGLGNLCLTGYLSITDVEADLPGVFHAPLSIDDGNNSNIEFSDGAASDTLYWIAGSGNWNVKNNWSKISGGCPSSISPNTSPHLVFNDNSLFEAGDEISVPETVTANQVYFFNSINDRPVLRIDAGLEVVKLVIDGGQVEFKGVDFINTGETIIDNGAQLISDISNFSTNTLTTNSGLFLLRLGSNVQVTGQ